MTPQTSAIKKKRTRILPHLALSLATLTLAGCVGGYYHATPSGQKVSLKKPMLTQSERQGGTYVLLEKSIADGKYQLVDISRERQKIANLRQERVVFSGDLQKYAIDFEKYRWETFVDAGNYDEKTDIMRCDASMSRDKLASYNPCSSEFQQTFVPFGVTKAYVAGRMSKAAKDAWEDRRQNNSIQAGDPWGALSDSGALAKLGIKRVDK